MKKFLILSAAFFLFGCDAVFPQMGPTEYGVRYRNLPRFLGGGLSSDVIEPGAMTVIFPWEKILRFNTAVQGISWGAADPASQSKTSRYVSTRALDGNEVALAVTVRYQIKNDRAGLVRMAQDFMVSDEEVEALVKATANADVRTYMNELHTFKYLERDARYRAVDKMKQSLKDALAPFNIEIVAVNLDDFRFERILEDGTVDSSYQEKLNETQRIREETEREKALIDTVIAKKQQEYNDTQAKVNRLVAEAEGYKKQAMSRGDSYLQSRSNEAKGLLAQGKAEVQGLIEKVNALSGPGGRALLKLELAKSIMKSDPKFIVMGSGTASNSLDVRRTDTNDLLRQAGIFEALQSTEEKKPARTERQSTMPAPEEDLTKQNSQNENKEN